MKEDKTEKEELEGQKRALFNAALKQLEILMNYKQMGDDCYLRRDYAGWHDYLILTYRLVEPELNKPEKKELYKLLNKATESVENMNKTWHNYIATCPNRLKSRFPYIAPIDVEKDLHKLDLFLEKCKSGHGLTMPRADDPRFALEGK